MKVFIPVLIPVCLSCFTNDVHPRILETYAGFIIVVSIVFHTLNSTISYISYFRHVCCPWPVKDPCLFGVIRSKSNFGHLDPTLIYGQKVRVELSALVFLKYLYYYSVDYNIHVHYSSEGCSNVVQYYIRVCMIESVLCTFCCFCFM